MPVFGVNNNDNMNFEEVDDDEKKPLSALKEDVVRSQSNSSSQSSKSSSPEKSYQTPRTVVARPPTSHGVPKQTPRAVVARPPTSHGVKKPKSSTPRQVQTKLNFVNGSPRISKPSGGHSPEKGKASSSKKLTKSLSIVTVDDSSDDEVLSNLATLSPMKSLANSPRKMLNKSPPKTIMKSGVSRSSGSFFSPVARREKRFQTFCTRLAKLWADAKRQSSTSKSVWKPYNTFSQLVIGTLQKSEMERIPDPDIRANILKRHAIFVERKKMQTMSEDEKAKYLKEKLLAQRKQSQEKQQNAKKRFEDTTVCVQPLPPPKPVTMPDGFNDCSFGDVIMVTNFLRAYAGLLTPKEDIRLTPEEFAKSLTDVENGHPYVAKILSILLHTLIHDEEAMLRKELGVKLTDLELNSSTAGELARLCLQKRNANYVQGNDDGDDERGSNSSYSYSFTENVDNIMLNELSDTDFHNLAPSTKLRIVIALINRLLDSVALENYVLDVQQQYSDAVTERNAAGQECNKLNKEAKQVDGESKPASPAVSTVTVEDSTGDEEDIASKVKKRRLMTEERQKREAEERLKKEKELAEYRIRNRYEVANRKLEDAVALKKMALRTEPLGTDRDHSRYWYFGKWLPIVFVEKGWSTYESTNKQEMMQDDLQEEEITFPKNEINSWFLYDSVEDVEALLQSLCTRGIRESKLKDQLQICCNEMKSNKQIFKTTLVLMATKDYLPIEEDFRAKLLQLETSIRSGGFGGQNEFDQWKCELETCISIVQMRDKLIEVCNGIRPTMLSGVMALDRQLDNVNREEEPDLEGKTVSKGLRRWCEAVRQCKTYGRLHVLMSVLRSCIRWDRSVEHSKCKICRKGHDDELALVCDSCNDVYHTYCLRPPLKKLPEGEWFCLSCKPRSQSRAAKVLRPNVYADDAEESEDSDKESESDQQNENLDRSGLCVVCGEGEFDDQSDELITCSECSTLFHLNCHTPPLRHSPRTLWRCHQCVTGHDIRSTRLRSKRKRDVRSGRRTASVKASMNLNNRDLFDDEGSSGDSD